MTSALLTQVQLAQTQWLLNSGTEQTGSSGINSHGIINVFLLHPNTFFPPNNLTATYVPDIAKLNWNAPLFSSGLIGYNIYRNYIQLNALPVTELSNADTAAPYSINHYMVSALYDLTPFGYPGLYGESASAGPAVINAIPSQLFVNNIKIGYGQFNCYNATGIINVAGTKTIVKQ